MIGGKTTFFEAIFHHILCLFVCSVLNEIKFYDENMSIVFFILISRDVYQKLMNTN